MAIEYLKEIYYTVKTEGVSTVVEDYVVDFMEKHPKLTEKTAPVWILACTLTDLLSNEEDDL